jgi:hypothetical protein
MDVESSGWNSMQRLPSLQQMRQQRRRIVTASLAPAPMEAVAATFEKGMQCKTLCFDDLPGL